MRITLAICTLLSALFFGTSTTYAQHRSSLASMKMVSSTTGWVITCNRLYWSTDSGRHWTDITPVLTQKREVAGAYFLDVSSGWVVLLRRSANTNDVSGFDLASTTDSGRSWSTHAIQIPEMSSDARFPGDARIYFLDNLNGWVNIGGPGSAAFNSGFLIDTTDGGRTWNQASAVADSEYGGRGKIFFTSKNDGWFTNGPELFLTHDSGHHWQKISLNAPAQLMPASNPAYGLPIVRNGRILLPVTYSSPYQPADRAQSAMALFSSDDMGETWQVNRIIKDLAITQNGEPLPSTIADSAWIVGAQLKRGDMGVVAVASEGTTEELAVTQSRVTKLDFADRLHGWLIEGNSKLLGTTDGGITWADITPGVSSSFKASHARPVSSQISEMAGVAAEPPGTATVSMRLGFDESLVAPPNPTMQQWWSSSPYFDVGFYLNGGRNRVHDPNLNAGWVTSVSNQGWGEIPLWVDLQAPCACKYGNGTYPNCKSGTYQYTISTDLTTAQQQGVSSADAAATSASGIGINGNIIYIDIEQYDIPSSLAQCGPAVVSFLNGWISEIQNKGYLAGAYGAPGDAANWNANVSLLPTDIWASKYDERVTIWGLQYGLTDSMWNTNQRIHQYAGTHSETWGGYSLNIDNDIVDAGVIAGAGSSSKNYSNFTFYGVIIGDATYTEVYGINDGSRMSGTYGVNPYPTHYGWVDTPSGPATLNYPGTQGLTLASKVNNLEQVVGWYSLSSNSDAASGYLYSGGSYTPISCNSSVCPNPYYVYVTGINDDGQIVGEWAQNSSEYSSGFAFNGSQYSSIAYPGALDTYVEAINGDGQVVGCYDTNGFDGQAFIYFAGNFQQVAYPGSPQTCFYDINNNGQIVGQYWDTSVPDYVEFLYDENTQVFTLLPQGFGSVEGINDLTQIVGYPGFCATVTAISPTC